MFINIALSFHTVTFIIILDLEHNNNNDTMLSRSLLFSLFFLLILLVCDLTYL